LMSGLNITAEVEPHARKAIEFFDRAGDAEARDATMREFGLVPDGTSKRRPKWIWVVVGIGLIALIATVIAIVIVSD